MCFFKGRVETGGVRIMSETLDNLGYLIEASRCRWNDFISGGILQRFPKLKFICSEKEVSWVPGFMYRMDTID